MTQDYSLLARHRPTLEHLEPRLPPGDGLLGMLLAWPDSVPEVGDVTCSETSESAGTEDEVPSVDGLSHQSIWLGGTESSMPRLLQRGLSVPPSLQSPDETIHGFASPDAAGVRRGFHTVSAWQTVKATGASLGGLTPAAQSSTFGSARAASPLLALRAITPHSPPREQGEPPVDESTVQENYGKFDLAFEENVGQSDSRVDFIARAGGYTAFLTPTGAVFSIQNSDSGESRGAGRVNALDAAGLQGDNTPRSPLSANGVALHMEIVGAKPQAAVGREELSGKVNYLIGSDPSQWHTNVATYGRVEYQGVYPGIDLVYYGRDQQLEYDFIVSAGADPNQIALNFAGAESALVDDDGDLVLHTAAGDLVQQKPYLYQDFNGVRQEVAGNFVLGNQYMALSTQHSALVTFDIGAYDPSRPLVIDPLVLGYSTFLGGSQSDDSFAMTVDKSGNAYVTGWTQSADFPTTPGAFDQIYDGPIIDGNPYEDAFVTKLNAAGAVVYSTFLGGGGGQEGCGGIAVDGSGSVYVTGVTTSYDFPTTPGAFGPLFNGDIDAFVTKLSPDGASLLYSTYLGASDGYDFAQAIAVDGSGNAYVTGDTTAVSFPTTPGAFDTTHAGGEDVFVTKVNASGTALVYSTFLGGSSYDFALGIAVGGNGYAFVTGYTNSGTFPTTPGAFDTTLESTDAFVTRLNLDGATLRYSTLLGAANEQRGIGIAVDGNANAYVTGYTNSGGFPTTPGAFDTSYNGLEDSFVTKVRGDGTGLLYSTFLGGTDYEAGYALALDGGGNAYITGYTRSTNFPISPGAFDNTHNGGSHDAYVTKLNAGGSAIAYSTYLGGSGVEDGAGIGVDGNCNVYVSGSTSSSNFPTTPDAFDTTYGGSGYNDAFVTKFRERACRVPAAAEPVVP